MNTPIVTPALELAQEALLNPSTNILVSSSVESIAKEAQAILASQGKNAALAYLVSKLKFEQGHFFSRNSFTTLAASVNELIKQSQQITYGVSNINNRKFPVDALIYGIALKFATETTPTTEAELGDAAYNNLTANATAALQCGEFELEYNSKVVFNELVRQFIYDGTVKNFPEYAMYYPLAAPILVKQETVVNPVIKMAVALTPGGGNSVFTEVDFKAIKITVRG